MLEILKVRTSRASMDDPPPLKLPSHDFLSQLARDDPQGFDRLRRELIENRITRAPEKIRHRLRLLQFRVDGICRLSGSPLGATLRIQALMWEYFLQMNDSLQELFGKTGPASGIPKAGAKAKPYPAKSARIIEFKPLAARKAESFAAKLKA